MSFKTMTLTDREKVIALVSNGATIFSLLQERAELPKDSDNLYDFILKIVPDNLKSKLSVELIDEILDNNITFAHDS